jgi:ribose 5-phosphate isomerase B
MSLKIAIGGDHAGYGLKEILVEKLEKDGCQVKDFGPFSEESVDYPDYVHPLATAVHNGEFDFGIAICSSGQGVTMTANKHEGIRAALCWTSELAGLARGHNNANVLCLPARFIEREVAKDCVDTFLKEPFEGGRHERRVKKIDC